MTCLDQPMVRRGRSRVGFVSVIAEHVIILGTFLRRRRGKVKDLNEYMLRDVGFSDGRLTEAAMRRAANCREGVEQF